MTDPNLTATEAVARMSHDLRDPWLHNEELCDKAADMLEALAARVAELEAAQEKTRRFLKISRKEGEDALIRAEAAEAQLAALDRMLQEARRDEREKALREAMRIAHESEDVYGARNMNGMAKCARNIAAAILALIQEPPR